VCAAGTASEELRNLRLLSSSERIYQFHRLGEGEKVDLFFQAAQRHPPYTGLDDAIENEGKMFLVILRRKLDERGGVPEVLSFMGIILDMKNHNLLSHSDIEDLRILGICRLAQRSKYCPELEAKILSR
jgi:hypothetical protein